MRDGMEILIPKTARKEVIKTLHLTHAATNTMLLQTKSRLFWPGMRAELDSYYSQCQECTQNRISRPQKQNQINMTSLFENFFPGSCVQIDFAQKDNDKFFGFMRSDEWVHAGI